MHFLKKPLVQLLGCLGLLLVVTIGVYYRSLELNFALDDQLVIYNNRDTRNLVFQFGSYRDFFTTSFYHGSLAESNDILYRPLSKSLIAWDYKRAEKRNPSYKEPDPKVFHQTNLVLYILCVWIIFFLIRTFFSHESHCNLFALGTALLFSTFPAHVPVVCNIKHREEILACLFGCFAFWLYIIYRRRSTKYDIIYLAAAAIVYLLAVLSKESALLFLPVFILYELSVHKGEWKHFIVRLKAFVPFLVMAAVWYMLRANAVGFRMGRDAAVNWNYSYFQMNEGILVRLLTEAKVFIRYYFWDALVTQKINPLFSSRYVVTTENTPSMEGVFSLVLIFFVIIVACYFIIAGREGQKRASFWILFFFVMLFTVSNIIRIDWLGAFRFIFTPSLSYCVLIMMIINTIIVHGSSSKRILSQILAGVLFLSLLGHFSFKTIQLIPNWKDDFHLNLYAASVEEKNPIVFANVGLFYGELNRRSEMIRYFERMVSAMQGHSQTMRFVPSKEKEIYADTLGELSVIYLESDLDLAYKRNQQALSVFHELERTWFLEKRKKIAQTYYVRALINSKRNRIQEAIEDCKTALGYDYDHSLARNLLSELSH